MASEEDKQRQADIIIEIIGLAAEIGWSLAIPDVNPDIGEKVPGILVGADSWINENAEMVFGPGFMIFDTDPLTGEMTERPAGEGGNKLH